MTSAEIYESLIVELAPLDRQQIIVRLTSVHPGLPLDFSHAFIDTCETDRLRHLLLAAEWRCRLKEGALA